VVVVVVRQKVGTTSSPIIFFAIRLPVQVAEHIFGRDTDSEASDEDGGDEGPSARGPVGSDGMVRVKKGGTGKALRDEAHNAAVDEFAARWRGVVATVRDRVLARLSAGAGTGAGAGAGAAAPASAWPNAEELHQLTECVRLFTEEERTRNVISPLMLFLSECLFSCPLRSVGDVGRGVATAALMVDCAGLTGSKTVVPEGECVWGLVNGALGTSPLRPTLSGHAHAPPPHVFPCWSWAHSLLPWGCYLTCGAV
jgi:hypothetical protein